MPETGRSRSQGGLCEDLARLLAERSIARHPGAWWRVRLQNCWTWLPAGHIHLKRGQFFLPELTDAPFFRHVHQFPVKAHLGGVGYLTPSEGPAAPCRS